MPIKDIYEAFERGIKVNAKIGRFPEGTKEEIHKRLKREEKQSYAIKQLKAYCEIFKGRSIKPEDVQALLKENLQ